MADLATTFCGLKVKSPVGVTSCDFGGHARLARRVAEQGIGWLVGKTVHRIDGPHRWPRPHFYSLRRFGPELRDAFVSSQMFHHLPYDRWLAEELPATLEVCREHGVLFIGSCCGIGEDPDTWIPFLRDMAAAGVEAIELDTGGPHATFGAVAAHHAVGAPLALDPETAYRVTLECAKAVDVPIIFKMTPQCVNMAEVSLAVERAGAAAISANNAFYGLWIDHETGTFLGVPAAMGGLMGRPWQVYSLAKLLEITATVQLPVIGGGGVFTYDDVVRHLMGGCSLVGMCSAVYARGVEVLGKVDRELRSWLDQKGHASLAAVQGTVVQDLRYLREWPRETEMADESPLLPVIDVSRCTECGRCARLCPYGALEMTGRPGEAPALETEHCCGCGWCTGQCPVGAITMVHAASGRMVWDGRGTIADWVGWE